MQKIINFTKIFGIKSEIARAKFYLGDVNLRKKYLTVYDKQNLDAAIARLRCARDTLAGELEKSKETPGIIEDER